LTDVKKRLGDRSSTTARATRNLAGILVNSARIGHAIELYRQALAIDGQAFGGASREAALDQLELGSILTTIGKFDEAQTALKSAGTIGDTQGDLQLTSLALEQMAYLAALRGAPAEGLVHMEALVNTLDKMFGADSPALVASLAQLRRFYLLTGRMNDALQVLERIKGLVGENPPEQSPGFMNALQFKAMLDADRGNLHDAEATFKRAIVVARTYGGPDAVAVGVNEFNLAVAYLRMKDFDGALGHFKAALRIFKGQRGDRALVVGYGLLGTAIAYAGKGDQANSAKSLANAVDILGPTIGARPQPKWL
jgi:tetratricopeptide (TPR) repeat protein